jgi:hypothetical protein
MQRAERSDRGPAAQHGLQRPVLQVTAAQSIAVRDEAAPAAELHRERLALESETDVLAQKAAAPGIVIATGHGNGRPGVDQPSQGRERPEVSARDDFAVLEPEVEEVAGNEQLAGLRADALEERDECALRAVRDGAEMDVGYDIVRSCHGARS